jgi:hypothetical protein
LGDVADVAHRFANAEPRSCHGRGTSPRCPKIAVSLFDLSVGLRSMAMVAFALVPVLGGLSGRTGTRWRKVR